MIAVEIGSSPGEWRGFQKDILEVVSIHPFAPGAPIALSIDGVALQGKSIGSKRQDDGRFVVRMRMINLRREHRDRLRAIADPS
ncbi:MAG: hypothetical protein AAGE52_27335 [Myxococcota bacterium]